MSGKHELRKWARSDLRGALSKFLWFAAGVFLFAVYGCTRQPDPQQIFEQVRLLYLRSDLVSARQEAHNAYVHFSDKNLEWAWKFRLLEAEILISQGLSREALALVDPPLPSLVARDLAVRKDTLQGLACALLGRFSEAEIKLQSAEAQLPSYSTSLNGEVARARGVVKLKQNDLDSAESYFRKSLQIAEVQHDEFLRLTDLLNLGAVALRKEHYDQAIDWSNSARQVTQSLAADRMEEKILGNLGWAYYRMGDYEKSLDLFEQAAAQAHNLGIVVDQVLWVNNLGLVYYELGRFSEAEAYYKQALDLAQQTQNQAEITDALTELALVSAKSGRLDSATDFSNQAYALAHKRNNRRDELYTLFAMGEIAQRSGNFQRASEVFTEIDNDQQSDSFLHWGVEHDLARLREQQNQPEAAEKEYKQSLGNLETARATLEREESRLPFSANAAAVYDDYVHFLAVHGRVGEALSVADYSRGQTLAEGLGLLRATKTTSFNPGLRDPRGIAAQANATILFYWLGKNQSYLWVVTPARVELFNLPPAQVIDDAVRRYGKAMADPRDPLEAGNEDGIALYQLLVEPAAKLIASASSVVIIPDGSLYSLNFETLLVPQPALHYWIDDVTVAEASSLQLLTASQTQRRDNQQQSRKLLLVGDPVTPNHDYGELPGAAAEMSQIASHFPQTQREVYARRAATAAAYENSNPGQFSFIHFVAHGTASRLSPLDSAVILSKSSAEEDSFKLYARDIVGYPLHAELVTISTCYGAGDRTFSGEGLVGLSWAFLRAGSHNVIGALWNVSDESTPGLMDRMYAELQNGKRPEDALRTAKLSLLHSQSVFRKPLYWAAFQLYTGS